MSPDERRAAHRAAGDFLSELVKNDRTSELGMTPLDTALYAYSQYISAEDYENAASIVFGLQQHLNARGNYRTLVELYKGVLPKDPLRDKPLLSDIETHNSVLVSLGNAYSALGKREEALTNYQTALKLRKNLLDSDPSNIIYQSDVAMTSNNIGALLDDMGKREQALTNYQIALKLRKNLLDSDPSNIIYQSDVAGTSNNIGLLLANMGKREEALEYYQKALKIFKDLNDEESAAVVNENIIILSAPAKE